MLVLITKILHVCHDNFKTLAQLLTCPFQCVFGAFSKLGYHNENSGDSYPRKSITDYVDNAKWVSDIERP